jgi:hypothetical protein
LAARKLAQSEGGKRVPATVERLRRQSIAKSASKRPAYYSCMAKLSGKEIQKLARSIVNENPGGIHYSALVEKISQQSPETPKNTVHGSVWNLDTIFPNEIAKPSRGLFTPVAKSGNEAAELGSTEQIASTGIKIKEWEFYEPFAEWLKNDLDEVTEVASLGGAGLKSKWGTPDVVGISTLSGCF